jgi:hypothetical protein
VAISNARPRLRRVSAPVLVLAAARVLLGAVPASAVTLHPVLQSRRQEQGPAAGNGYLVRSMDSSSDR